MKKVKIQICLLGYQRYESEIKKLRKSRSKLFEICNYIEIKNLPDPDIDNWKYSDAAIVNILKTSNVDNNKYDLCICYIDSPIQANYFSRDLYGYDSKTVVCSFYQVEDIFSKDNINLYNYIHGSILFHMVQIVTIHKIDERAFLHNNTRRCLFDMCTLKSDIAIKYSEPKLCSECRAKIESNAVDKDFLSLLEKEFKSFKKPVFNRILEFIRKHPVLSILITSAATIILNLLSSLIFEIIKFYVIQ